MRRVLTCAALVAALSLPVAVQDADQSGPGVIRVTTTLVQFDAVVTDRQGRPVTTLTQGDFEILQDGKPRPVSTFSVVRAGPRADAGPGPVRMLAREQVRRTIAFVVDDFTVPAPVATAGIGPSIPIPNESVVRRLRELLTRFFDTGTREGDLMTLLTLGRHQGGFEQFTTDRELLKSLASRIQFNPVQLITLSAGVSMLPMIPPDDGRADDGSALQRSDAFSDCSSASDARLAPLREMHEASIAALQAIVDAMRPMPGRKSIVLFSTCFPDTQPALRLIERANAAGVAVYTIDPRDPPMAGDRYGLKAAVSLAALADRTGGRSFGPGDLEGRLDAALADQESYYVLGYDPGDATFDRRFHTLEVRVRGEGLRVRARSGFDGRTDDAEPMPRDSEGILSRLLTSPYRSTTIRTTVATLFSADGGTPTLRSVVFVDGRDLQAEKTGDGPFRGGLETMVAVVDPSGEISGRTARGVRFTLDADGWRRTSETGLAFVVPHPAGKPGPYQVRVAVRDAVSGDTGSATAFLTVPDLTKSGLTLSGIALTAPPGEPDPYPLSMPAARTFRQGREAAWLVEVYNARPGPKTDDGLPQLDVSVRVHGDGRVLVETPFTPATLQRLKGRRDVSVQGRLSVDGPLGPGDYVLQVILRDRNAPAKTSPAVQTVDFRVVP